MASSRPVIMPHEPRNDSCDSSCQGIRDQQTGQRGDTYETTIVQLRVRVDDSDDLVPRETLLDFECDWTPGIGGSIWTSGELLAAYLELQRASYRSVFHGACVVELGSGTGYVGLMVAACFRPAHVYLTDLHSHVHGLRRNVKRNAGAMRSDVQVHVSELSWGSSEQQTTLLETIASRTTGGTEHSGAAQVDVIVGTDVAYLQELYDPLLQTINRLATSRTVILLGLNRDDTGVAFFQQLERDGFEYYRIPDAKLPQEYWGRDFGLFDIRRRHDCV
ncbi:unnamed protein product [Hyaloperonospora brassicae]|uniref:FAM86 N-terminal domain-containing protein n=1 Tax=Hyaloperonospora brassicae TaxID=162125 RepID=A0AAV0UPB2_HYABA|nr:unnamed protein product [Hyaloperonospora brassicae]